MNPNLAMVTIISTKIHQCITNALVAYSRDSDSQCVPQTILNSRYTNISCPFKRNIFATMDTVVNICEYEVILLCHEVQTLVRSVIYGWGGGWVGDGELLQAYTR